jgi:hypothetical protein
MKELFTLAIILLIFSCSGQNNTNSVTLKHSPVDTAASFKRKQYILYSYIPNYFPIDCGTEFWVVPNKNGEKYEFKSTNSMIITSIEGNKVVVIPNKETFKLSIIKAGKVLEEVDFKAKKLKEPTITVYSDSFANDLNIIPIKTDSLQVMIEQPEMKYRRIYPKDCQYSSDSIAISLLREQKVIRTEMTKIGKVSLRDFKLAKNDKLVIKVNNVKRRNFMGELFPVSDEIRKEYTIK